MSFKHILDDDSSTFKKVCFHCLQDDARDKLGNRRFKLNSYLPVGDYIRVMTIKKGLVMRGSERYVGLEESLYRSVSSGDKSLFTYFSSLMNRIEAITIMIAASIVKRQWKIFATLMKGTKLTKDGLAYMYALALKTGFKEFIGYLSREGSDVMQAQDVLSFTSLLGVISLIRYVEEVFPPFTGDDYSSALASASISRKHRAIKYLIDKAGDIQEALVAVAEEGHLDLVRYFSDKLDSERKDVLLDAFTEAVINNHEDIAQYLHAKLTDFIQTN